MSEHSPLTRDFEESIAIIQDARDRVQVVTWKRQAVVPAYSAGETMKVHFRDWFHGLDMEVRTPRRSDGSYAEENRTWRFDDRDDTIDEWDVVVDHIASRVEAGWYEGRSDDVGGDSESPVDDADPSSN